MGNIRKAFTLLLAGLFLISIATVQPFTVKAQTPNQNSKIIPNPYNNLTLLNVTVLSPEQITYNKTEVSLNFTLESDAEPQQLTISGELFDLYSKPIVALDRETNNITNIIEKDDYFHFQEDASIVFTKLGSNLYSGSAILSDLSQGGHNVTIGIIANVNLLSYGYPAGYFFTTIPFNVDSIPPSISILSIQNNSVSEGTIPVNFAVNKPISKISYCIDGAENIPLSGNFTLSNLPVGNHNVTIYATDQAGNVGSQTVNFEVKPQFSIFGIATVLVIIIPVVIVFAIATLVLRRHKKTRLHH